MFQRFRGSTGASHTSARKEPARNVPYDCEELPFDLELTRRVNGERMPPKWGTRDPAEASAMDERFEPLVPAEHDEFIEVAEAYYPGGLVIADHKPSKRPAAWAAVPRTRFGNGATPIEVQSRLIGRDHNMLRAFDDLRTQLLRAIHGGGCSRIAITAPTSGSGASFTAVNLALSIARIPGMRALLMDLDQRDPSLAGMLGMKAGSGLQSLLAGNAYPEDHLVQPCETLALGLGRGRSNTASELLHAPRTGAVMDAMLDRLRPDIALFDLPAMLEHDDLEAFLPHVDGVLLVADATRTLARQIKECERRLEGKTNLLGVILNRTRPARRTRTAPRRAA